MMQDIWLFNQDTFPHIVNWTPGGNQESNSKLRFFTPSGGVTELESPDEVATELESPDAVATEYDTLTRDWRGRSSPLSVTRASDEPTESDGETHLVMISTFDDPLQPSQRSFSEMVDDPSVPSSNSQAPYWPHERQKMNAVICTIAMVVEMPSCMHHVYYYHTYQTWCKYQTWCDATRSNVD